MALERPQGEIRLLAHAAKQARIRQISEDQVARVLAEPSQICEEKLGRIALQSKFVDSQGRERLLRVILEKVGENWVAVTVYSTSRIRKYWRES